MPVDWRVSRADSNSPQPVWEQVLQAYCAILGLQFFFGEVWIRPVFNVTFTVALLYNLAF
jgi:hypothetical protein